MSAIQALAVASEVYPLIKTGGLADVAGALPLSLQAQGVATRTLLPGYPAVLSKLEAAETLHAWSDYFGGPGRLLSARHGGLDLLVLDAPHLYARDGGPYAGPDGQDWSDNGRRFAALARAAASLGQGLVPGFTPDVIHAHDWQAGLVPTYLRYNGGGPKTVFTVHNLAFQGQFPASLLEEIELPPAAFTMEGVEYFGGIGFLKAGLQLADRITTVSPSYAREIQTADGGMGLDGLLRYRAEALTGILNGIDADVWNPATDPLIAARYDEARLDARRGNRTALQQRFGLAPRSDAPVLGVVSRLSWQKGLDLVVDALPDLLGRGMQLALLGAGDPELEAAFQAAARDNPGRVGVTIGYDEALAHAIQAGADALLVPSRFEPCGLTQLCALRYGAIPVVAKVGGLADSIVDIAEADGTGVQFAPVTAEAFRAAMDRLAALFAQPDAWRIVQRRGMATDVSWCKPAEDYAALYRSLVRPR